MKEVKMLSKIDIISFYAIDGIKYWESIINFYFREYIHLNHISEESEID